MRRSAAFALLLFALAAARSFSQAVESAETGRLTVTAGGMGSAFQPGEGKNILYGPGVFVDAHFSHWVQIEAEGRWLRFNQYYGEHEDQYLIGPRVPITHFGKAQVFGKALIGYGKETFPFGYGYGSFTALAFGGTLDYRVSRRLTLRAADFEYQYWPVWLNNKSLSPYGVSVGLGYRVF